MDVEWYFVDGAGEECGPCSTRAVARLVFGGQLTEESLVRRAGGPIKYQRFVSFKALREEAHALASAATSAHEASALPAEGPAATSDAHPDTGDDRWFYRDDGDNVRGPLTTVQVGELVASGMLGPPREVSRGSKDGPFIDIQHWPELWPPRLDGATGNREEIAFADGWKGFSDAPMDGAAPDDEGAEWEEEPVEWVYRDDRGGLQGPFSTTELKGWLATGLLKGSRLVNLAGGEDSDFRPAAEWAELSPAAPGKGAPQAADLAVAKTESAVTKTKDMQRGETGGARTDGASTALEVVEGGTGALAASPATWEPGSVSEWVYVDDSGQEQGPFPAAKLLSWLTRGFLTTERQVRPASGGEWQAMATWPEFAGFGKEASVAAAVDTMVAAEGSGAARGEDGSAAVGAAAAAPGPGSVTAVGPVDAGVGLSVSEWVYVDDSGQEQGPFPTAKLLSWLTRGVLTTERQVRPASGGEWQAMATWPEFAGFGKEASVAAARDGTPCVNGGAPLTAEDEMLSLWEYADDRGRMQGPFTAGKLIGWLQAGHINLAR